MRSQREEIMVSVQLEFLKSRKQHLESLISDINQATEFGENWLAGTDSSMNFTQILQYIESVIEDTSQKCLQIADRQPQKDSSHLVQCASPQSVTNPKQESQTDKKTEELNSLRETIMKNERRFEQIEKECESMKSALKCQAQVIGTLNKRQASSAEKFDAPEDARIKRTQSLEATSGTSTNTEIVTMKQTIDNFTRRFQTELDLMYSSRREFVGFSARINSELEVKSDVILNCFTVITCHEGNCFNPCMGIFTAPNSGQYVVSLSLDSTIPGVADAFITKRDNKNKESVKAAVHLSVQNMNACNVCLVEMFKMEEIYVKIICSHAAATKLSSYSTFSCFSV